MREKGFSCKHNPLHALRAYAWLLVPDQNVVLSFFFWQERESAVSEAYSKGVKEGKEQAGANEKQPSVNVTDEVS